MAHTIYVGKISKRKNSTLQPTLTDSFDVLLKTPTSLHSPTFTISAASFDYNYIKWGDRYYFVTDVTSRNNNLWEVSATIDVLATFKSDILASTQFVCYSSQVGNTWLADTRIPVLKSTTAARNSVLTGILSRIGCYILSAVGKDRCYTYMIPSEGTLGALLTTIADWTQTDVDALMDQLTFSGTDAAIESLTKLLTRTSLMGNAYEAAPACIRSCIWVPFDNALAPSISSNNIWLGRYDTGISATVISGKPVMSGVTVSIPWHFSDWRRAYCEQIYLYLPLVGTVALSTDSLTNVSSLTVYWSVAYTDGTICYMVEAGNEIIGTYSGQCATNYPLGIAQQASAGQIANTFISGVEHTVAESVDAGLDVVGVAVEAGAGLLKTTWDVSNAALTSHPSCVGGIGGGAGSGFDLHIICYSVAHDTIVNPADMLGTMGRPTMKPLALSTLTGFCQCANAHVAASGAELQELNEIDAYLNSGFYIE